MHDPLPILTVRELLQSESFLRNLAGALQPDRQHAEDLVQQTWLQALQRPPSRPEALRAWLATTARFLAGKQRRGEVRRDRRERAAARPESVRATDEIVEKLELEQRIVQAVLALRDPFRSTLLLRYYEDLPLARIAERQGVALNTVRSRLRRGLAELRANLVPRGPSRLRALGMAGTGFTGSQPATATVGTTLGVMLMKSKAALWILLPVVLGGLALVVPFVLQDPDPMVLPDGTSTDVAGAGFVPGSAMDAAPRGRDGAEPPPPDPMNAAATPGAGGPMATRVAENDGPALGRPGTIRFVMLDRRTEEPMDGVTVRFVGESRFAELNADGEVEALLTPDRYDLALSRRGYDPVHRPAIKLVEEQELDLGEIEMAPGSGWIEGRLTAPHLESDAVLAVDLYGAGRHPCNRCAEFPVEVAESEEEESEETEDATGLVWSEVAAVEVDRDAAWDRDEFCPECGFSGGFSRWMVRPGGRFAFSNLAAGRYTVRVWSDEHQPIGRTEVVDLEARGRAWLELRVIETAAAHFVLLDENGGEFKGYRTGEDGEIECDLILFSVYRDGVKVGQSSFWPTGATSMAMGNVFHRVLLSDVEFAYEELMEVESFVMDSEFLWQDLTNRPEPEPEPLDRERTPEDELFPVDESPDFDPAGIVASHERDYTLTRLPCMPLEVQVSSGEYRSDRIPFHPNRWSTTTTVVVMKECDEPPEEEGEILSVISHGSVSFWANGPIEVTTDVYGTDLLIQSGSEEDG